MNNKKMGEVHGHTNDVNPVIIDPVTQEQLHLNLEKEMEEETVLVDGEEVLVSDEEVVTNDDEIIANMEKSMEEVQELDREQPLEVVSYTEDTLKSYNSGKIQDCNKLYVRKEPSKESEVVTTLDENSIVVVDEKNSTEDFYRVEVNALVGYCVKKFIRIN